MKQITCITCPIGCRITVEYQFNINQKDLHITGNKCLKGIDFARAEIISPVRSLTTTVRTTFPEVPVLSVKTKGEVPKEKINVIIRELSDIMISEKIGIGETVVSNIAGTGCDIIATSNKLKELMNVKTILDCINY